MNENSEVFQAGRAIANAITPRGSSPSHDDAGVCVDSLTEAVMGITAALCRVADALGAIANAIESHGDK